MIILIIFFFRREPVNIICVVGTLGVKNIFDHTYKSIFFHSGKWICAYVCVYVASGKRFVMDSTGSPIN